MTISTRFPRVSQLRQQGIRFLIIPGIDKVLGVPPKFNNLTVEYEKYPIDSANGSTQYQEYDASLLAFGTGPFSISLLVKPNSGTVSGGALIGNNRSGTAGGLLLYRSAGQLRINTNASFGANLATTVSIWDNTWHFITVTRSATGTYSWFVDGNSDTTVTVSPFDVSSGFDTMIGAQRTVTTPTAYAWAKFAIIIGHNRNISLDEHRALRVNPWQLFAPLEKPIFSAIDSVRIRGPKPRQVVRTTQPQTPLSAGTSGILNNFVTAVPNRLIYDSGLSAYYPTEFSYGETKSRGGLGVGTPQSFPQPIFGTSNATDFTFCVRLDLIPGATADSSVILGNPNYSSGSELGIGHRRVDGTTVRLWISYYVGAQQRCLVIADFIGSAQYNKTVFFIKSGTDVSILMDGIVLATTVITIHQASGQKFRFNGGWGAWAKQAPISFAGYVTRALTVSEMTNLSQNPWNLFANSEQPFWHTEFVQPKKFFPALALPVPKNITSSSVTPQVTLSF